MAFEGPGCAIPSLLVNTSLGRGLASWASRAAPSRATRPHPTQASRGQPVAVLSPASNRCRRRPLRSAVSVAGVRITSASEMACCRPAVAEDHRGRRLAGRPQGQPPPRPAPRQQLIGTPRPAGPRGGSSLGRGLAAARSTCGSGRGRAGRVLEAGRGADNHRGPRARRRRGSAAKCRGRELHKAGRRAPHRAAPQQPCGTRQQPPRLSSKLRQ